MSSAPSLAPATPMGQAAEHLQVRLRPDLIVQPQFYEGMTHYVIKDPIALKYFRFKVEEYFLLQQFDGKNTLQDVKRAFERKYRPQTISIDDLIRFASQLHEAGIATVDSPEQAKALITRRRKKKWKKVGQFFANILYIKIPIIDPERLLTAMYPYFRWIYTSLLHHLQRRHDARRADSGRQPVQHLQRTPARLPELLQLAHDRLLLVQPGGHQDHPRVRPRPHRQALRRRGPRDGRPCSWCSRRPCIAT